MEERFDVRRFRGSRESSSQYESQLARLRSREQQVDAIETAVRGAVRNLREEHCRSFVIYGEPQSGKTEMMICLTGKLLDEGYAFIVHLLNDSVDLLNQNLGRFKGSGLAPSARNFSEILDPAYVLKGRRHVVFCKKNARDLAKLLNKSAGLREVVVIDDEADYASPNSKINKGEQTRINELIEKVLGKDGIYIGVTATPARLDLNNTFHNDSDLWVSFPPHSFYTGQDDFFPIDGSPKYRLNLLPDKGDEPKYAREAFFGFLVSVAYLNKYVNSREECYSMLVHTSGKKIDHIKDWREINDTLGKLVDQDSDKFPQYIERIWTIARSRYPDVSTDELTRYIVDNISRYSVIVLNSDKDISANDGTASNPASLFTIIIGGNIVSRGVTFNNLLSMFFTRDVSHKIQQDTYIQRARMFGSRGKYLRQFELTIPRHLYEDWHRCFVFHRLALAAIRENLGSPVWLSDHRIQAVATASIDQSTVDMDKGEMSFAPFSYSSDVETIVAGTESSISKLDRLGRLTGDEGLPGYLVRFIHRTLLTGDNSISFRKPTSIHNYKDADAEKIQRKKGLMGQTARDGAGAVHHIGIFFNNIGKARVFYRFNGTVQFIKNTRND